MAIVNNLRSENMALVPTELEPWMWPFVDRPCSEPCASPGTCSERKVRQRLSCEGADETASARKRNLPLPDDLKRQHFGVNEENVE